jgi:succinate dehydrogenase / fumarate reductase cytochrome b subunit
MTNDRAPLSRRLHSLTGVVPLGLFVVIHLFANGAAMSGDTAYARIARPIAFPLAVVVVYAPLAFHLVYGTWLTVRRIPFSEPQPNTYLRVLQRIAGVVVLLFVVFHVVALRLARARTGFDPAAIHTKLTEHLSSTWAGMPLVAVAYVFGVAAVVFHLTYGIWTFARPKTKRATYAWGAGGVLLFVVGVGTVVSVATGSRFLPAVSTGPKPTSCP